MTQRAFDNKIAKLDTLEKAAKKLKTQIKMLKRETKNAKITPRRFEFDFIPKRA